MKKQTEQWITRLNSTLSPQKVAFKEYQIKQKARLCVCLVFLIQTILKFVSLHFDPSTTSISTTSLVISLPFSAVIAIIIVAEYFLFQKKGSKIVKYSWIVDVIVMICFMVDWIAVTITPLLNIRQANSSQLPISATLTFTAFSWRTLFVTLLVQKWYWKIISPVVVLTLTIVYVVLLMPGSIVFQLIRALAQIFNVIVIIYCEDKVKWKLMRTSLYQEKWNQVNNFILDSIPENIMILDLEGEGKMKFMSENCKTFLGRYSFSILNPKGFFKSVKDLHQQLLNETSHSSVANPEEEVPGVLQSERCRPFTELKNEFEEFEKVETLEDLVKDFKKIIGKKKIEERQFLIYNGKLKVTDGPQKAKSIEVKISFVQHLENDYIILIFRDTTQRDLLMTLEQNNKYKDQLLASVSHELRAPLNGNINLIESAIASPKVPNNIKENLLTPALRSSKFLLHMINDILDMSQIKQKKLRLVFQPGDLKETLQSTLQLVELQAKKKGIELKMRQNCKLPKSFCTDHIRLSQIILNLLTNAIKFTREGEIKLIIDPVDSMPFCYKIIVQDSGIGISSENVKKLFSNYTHIEFQERQEMNPTGVGLGLHIAYSLAELLGPINKRQGIKVESILNQGSTFSLIIEDKETDGLKKAQSLEDPSNSYQDVAEEELIETSGPIILSTFHILPHSSPGRKTEPQFLFEECSCPKVLIVDDNPFNTMAFETILSGLGIKHESVYNGSACIQKLLKRLKEPCCQQCQQYAVIFMDQEMPEMNGIETVNEIKRLQRENVLPEMKIIGCTAHQSKEEVDRFMDAGLDQCISKPISIVMIKNILKDALVS